MNYKTGMATAILLGAMALPAGAATVGFSNIFPTTGDETVGDALVGNFSLDVSKIDTTHVLIKVINAAHTGTDFIAGIFIDDLPSALLSAEATAFSLVNSTGLVKFTHDSSAGNFPQGNKVGFGTTDSYIRDTGRGCTANACGVQQGESAGFLFGGDYATVLASLQSGGLRFGIHVQSIDGKSDSFVTPGPKVDPVPVPAAGLMLLAGLGGLGALKRKRKAA